MQRNGGVEPSERGEAQLRCRETYACVDEKYGNTNHGTAEKLYHKVKRNMRLVNEQIGISRGIMGQSREAVKNHLTSAVNFSS